MKATLRTLTAVLAGLASAFALIVGIEMLAEIAHPAAPFKGDIPAQVRQYPHWVLALVVLAWGATGAIATWLAARIGQRLAGSIVAGLLTLAVYANISMLPYTVWFQILMGVTFPIACWLGLRRSALNP